MATVPAQSQIATASLAKRALRVSEIQHACGWGKTFTYKLIREGKLRTVKINGMRLVPVDELEALLSPK